jgi:pilus assembly protein Flp/PilA
MELLNMFTTLARFMKDDSGATAIEYGLIAALVSVAAIGALTALGTNLSNMFNTVSSSVATASSG